MSWFNAHYYVKASSKFSWILTYEYEFIATFNTLFDVTSLSWVVGRRECCQNKVYYYFVVTLIHFIPVAT